MVQVRESPTHALCEKSRPLTLYLSSNSISFTFCTSSKTTDHSTLNQPSSVLTSSPHPSRLQEHFPKWQNGNHLPRFLLPPSRAPHRHMGSRHQRHCVHLRLFPTVIRGQALQRAHQSHQIQPPLRGFTTSEFGKPTKFIMPMNYVSTVQAG